ncbi:amidohydrolase [Pseudohongiella spirulinae]|uniref:Amidohydrolase family protein n=1 Tax=Pseudohongiella spirulinae TaxID=1249552 RepID=A0A0S2KBY3_9GAMM|nr:amidohydrolase [Pseudohongiella spirulinae]ALO45847.1 Amidohydrolase family protein [Pseudohongiella spirulinae]
MKKLLMSCLIGLSFSAQAQVPALPDAVESLVDGVMPQVVEWRRDFHQHPELGNREFRTAGIIADHLRALGMEVQTEVAHTGVVGILRGGREGPVVALRADMDALPVEEQVDLPFASRVRTQYNGQDVGVMHACGHDNHMAILMGAATVLADMRDELQGTVMFIFQPAEEGAPEGEEGGAELMLKEGLFDDIRPDAVFGLHVWPIPAGQIAVREGGTMASSDSFRIRVQGQQTHGAAPWAGIDPIVVASQIVMGLQTIPSRQLDATLTPSIVTVGAINGGVRSNIIPDSVEMIGTLRTFDAETRRQIHERVERTATQIAASAGATVDVNISLGYPVTYNDPELTRNMAPTLQRVAGERFVEASLITGAEDFSYYANEVPGMFFFLGIGADDPAMVYPNHSPFFYADERALPVGVKAMTALALDFMNGNGL